MNANTNIPVNADPAIAYSNGSGANQAQVLFQATRTLSGSTDTLDLQSGLTDSYGTAVDLTGVTAIFFQNNSSADNIVIGDAGSDPWSGLLSATGTITLTPGDWFLAATAKSGGWAVSSTSLNILVTGTSGQTYDVVFLGVGT